MRCAIPYGGQSYKVALRLFLWIQFEIGACISKLEHMVKLNKSTRFGLYSVLELGRNPEAILSVKEIAEKYAISEHHVAKVLQQLARAGLVRSIRGLKGGFQIAKPCQQITMMDVIEVFEPAHRNDGCLLVDLDESCDFHGSCAIGNVFDEIQQQAVATLKSISITTLIAPKKLT